MNIDDFDSYEAFLTRVNPIIESQAWAIAQACMYLYHTSIDPQDLAQSARIYLWQYRERRPDTPVNMLLLLGRLRMYGERQRGRSVLRPHPGKRTRVYEQADLAQADLVAVADLDPVPMLSDQQELALLYTACSKPDRHRTRRRSMPPSWRCAALPERYKMLTCTTRPTGGGGSGGTGNEARKQGDSLRQHSTRDVRHLLPSNEAGHSRSEHVDQPMVVRQAACIRSPHRLHAPGEDSHDTDLSLGLRRTPERSAFRKQPRGADPR